MDAQQNDEPEPIRKFRGNGWFNVWGLLLGIFVVLLCECAYRILLLGLRGALDNDYFGYEAFFTALLGILLLGRWTIPDLLLNRDNIDPRNANLMRNPRSSWRYRDYFRRKR